jgi:2-methylcitrate dehydratase PrpD
MDDSAGPSAVLSRLASRTVFETLPASAVRSAKWSLLDSLGVMLGATGLEAACAPFSSYAIDAGGTGKCLVLGTEHLANAPLAALANGALAHALDFEDAYDGAPVHPNAAVVPAALAMAQQLGGISGSHLLTAIAIGADLVCRLGLALRANPESWGWYPPAIMNTWGAATAAARVASLNPAQMIDAWSLAMCQNRIGTQFKRTSDSTLRAVRDAFTAQAGVIAASLAQRGARAFDAPLEGEAGFYALYAGGNYCRERLIQDAGTVFEGSHVSYKP